MSAPFTPNTGMGLEARIAKLEAAIQELRARGITVAPAGPTGRVVINEENIDGELPIAGDVTGDLSDTQVEKIWSLAIPQPAAGDDEKALAYEHTGTPAFKWVTLASSTLAGDVTGAIGSNTVEKIRGKNVPAPGAGDDEKALVYDHDTGAFKYVSPGTGASQKGPLGAWGKDNASILGLTDEEIFNVWTKKADNKVPRRLSGAGTLKSLSCTMDAAITGGGSIIVTAYLNGVATALTVTLSGAEESDHANVDVSFASGDLLEVWAKRSGTVSNTPSLEAIVEGLYTP